jgi:GntR family transcriptional regulator
VDERFTTSHLVVDPTSVLPAYVQLRDALRALVDTGELSTGDHLPPERRLADNLGISIIDVRHAMQALEQAGILSRGKGAAMFVPEPRIVRDVGLLASQTAELRRSGFKSRTTVLDFGFRRPDRGVLAALEVGDDPEAAVRLVRVRWIDNLPCTLETSWLPAPLGAALIGCDLADASLFEILTANGNFVPVRAKEHISATTLGLFDARELQHVRGAPAFLLERTTYNADALPLEHTRTILRGDRFSLAAVLHPPARSS